MTRKLTTDRIFRHGDAREIVFINLSRTLERMLKECIPESLFEFIERDYPDQSKRAIFDCVRAENEKSGRK